MYHCYTAENLENQWKRNEMLILQSQFSPVEHKLCETGGVHDNEQSSSGM